MKNLSLLLFLIFLWDTSFAQKPQKAVLKNDTLQRLGLGYNHLFFVPDLSGLKALKEVDLQHNNLSHFPWKLAESSTVQILILRNNPFVLTFGEQEKLQRLKKVKRVHGYTFIS